MHARRSTSDHAADAARPSQERGFAQVGTARQLFEPTEILMVRTAPAPPRAN